MEEYAKLIQETKNTRLKYLLNQTDSYIATINSMIQDPNNIEFDSSVAVNVATTEMKQLEDTAITVSSATNQSRTEHNNNARNMNKNRKGTKVQNDSHE